MTKLPTLSRYDALFVLLALLCYLFWDMPEIDRSMKTVDNLVAMTVFSILVGLPFRLLCHRLSARVAMVYARAVTAIAGVILFFHWVGPAMLVIASAGPVLLLGVGDFSAWQQMWLKLNAWYFVAFSLSGGFARDTQITANTICGVVLFLIPLTDAWAKLTASNVDEGVDIT